MMLSFRRALAPTAIFLATAVLVRAHPGHAGHELTWDLRHLAANPGATLWCFGVVGAAAWGLWKMTRSAAPAVKRVRVRSDETRHRR